MAIKIPSDLKTLIDTNQRIIHGLKVQKARTDLLLEKYENEVKEEMEIPSNLFIPVFKVLGPFLDQVISSKLMDFELNKSLDSFTKELIKYNADFIISEGQIEYLEYGFDNLVSSIIHLESTLRKTRTDNYRMLMRAKQHSIDQNNKLNPEKELQVGKCLHCGISLNKKEIANGDVCEICIKIEKDNDKQKPVEAEKPKITDEIPEAELEELPEKEDEQIDSSFFGNSEKPKKSTNSEEEKESSKQDEKNVDDADDQEEEKITPNPKVKPEIRKQFKNLLKGYQENDKKTKNKSEADKIMEDPEYLDKMLG